MQKPSQPEGILVLGLPRSGTTLLRRLLDAHSGISCPGETNLFGAAARFLRSDSVAATIPIGVLSSLQFLDYQPEDVVDRMREFVFRFHRETSQRRGKRRWADKSPLDVFYLEQIETLVSGRAQFICLHRHALDVALSLQGFCDKAGGYYAEIHPYIARFREPLVAFVTIWVEKTRQLIELEKRHSSGAVSLKYEDLIADPDGQLQRVLRSIGEEFEPGIIQRALADHDNLGLGDWKTYSKDQIDSSSVGKWKQLPARMIEKLAEIANPTLVELGYPAVTLQDTDADMDDQRKYEVGLLVQQMRKK